MARALSGSLKKAAEDVSGMRNRLWIKICGTTSLEDAQCAVAAGADALGFVFAPSPRQVSAAQAAAITAQLPPEVEAYGVFVHPSFAEVIETVEKAALSGVQLHASSDRLLPRRLREHFDANHARKRVSILQVLHYPANGEDFQSVLREAERDSAADGILIDSRSGAAQGGTGLRFDWQQARSQLLQAAPHTRLIAAGGLRPENVAEAVSTLCPWGVDVATGVEAAPGRRDPARVRDFIQRARAAIPSPASGQ